MPPLVFAFERDPDDTFRFAPIVDRAVATNGVEFTCVEEEVQALTARLLAGECDVAVAPLPLYAAVSERYRPLTVGFTVGDGYGPLIVANRIFIEFEIDETTLIYVPTVHASESVVLRLYSPACQIKEWSSEDMLKAIVDHRIETGVVSDQGLVSFGYHGVYKIEDLGEWWKFETKGQPLVTSCILVRRSLGDEVAKNVQRALKASILHAVENRDAHLAKAKRNARGANDWTVDKFVALSVTKESVEPSAATLGGAKELLTRAHAKGLIAKVPELDLVPDAP